MNSNINQLQLIYSNMDISNQINFNYCNLNTTIYDISINDTPQDHFNYLLDLAIEYGDIKYIQQAIYLYKNVIHKSYIDNANALSVQIIEEQIEDMNI
tara:strand:- start:320 stop:613 length:294 start_codon:yes stop_codon:yes gene_type:complete